MIYHLGKCVGGGRGLPQKGAELRKTVTWIIPFSISETDWLKHPFSQITSNNDFLSSHHHSLSLSNPTLFSFQRHTDLKLHTFSIPPPGNLSLSLSRSQIRFRFGYVIYDLLILLLAESERPYGLPCGALRRRTICGGDRGVRVLFAPVSGSRRWRRRRSCGFGSRFRRLKAYCHECHQLHSLLQLAGTYTNYLLFISIID